MGRVYQPRKGSAWYLDYYSNGKRLRQKVDGGKEEAERILKRREAEEALRQCGARGQASNRVSIEAVKDAWLQDVDIRCKPKTAKSYRDCLNKILERIPARAVEQVNPAMMSAYAAAALTGGVPRITKTKSGQRIDTVDVGERTVNMHIGALKSMLTWAASAGLIENNPLASVKPLKQRRRKYRRALTENEARALMEHSPEPYRRMWMFLLGTGCRRGEMVGLTWEDVDLDAQEMHLSAAHSKNNSPATVRLPNTVVDMLRKLRGKTGATSGHVFLNKEGRPWNNNLLKRFKACLVEAGIYFKNREGVALGENRKPLPKGTRPIPDPGVDIHSLRVSFITHLIRAGVNVKTVQRLARHKTIHVTLDIYARSFPEDEREAVEMLPYLSQPMDNKAARKGRIVNVA